MKTVHKVVNDGRVAQELMRQLDPHVNTLRARYKDRWAQVDCGADEREDLHRKVVVLEQLETEILRAVQEGRVAQEIERSRIELMEP